MRHSKLLFLLFALLLLHNSFAAVNHHGLTDKQWKYYAFSLDSHGEVAEMFADSLLNISIQQNSKIGELYAHLRFLDIAYANLELEKTTNESSKVCELSIATKDMSNYYYATAQNIKLRISKQLYSECPPLLFKMKKDLQTLYNDKKGWAYYYHALARYQQNRMIYHEAEENFTKSMEIAQGIEELPESFTAMIMIDRCWSYIGLENYEKVAKDIPAILCYNITPLDKANCHTFACLANAYLGNKKQFHEHYSHLKELNLRISNRSDSIFVEAYHELFTKGTINWQHYKEILPEIKYTKLLYLINKMEGNYDKALQYFEKFASHQRKIYGDVYNTDASLLNAQLVNEELNQKNEELQLEQEAQRRKLNLLLAAFAVLGIISMLLIFVYKNHYKQIELKKLETANIIANDKLEKAIAGEHNKTLLIQNMSHEIRTPLNAVMGFSQLLALPIDMVTDEERQEYVQFIHTNSQLLTILVDDVLTISDLEHDNMYINIDICNLNQIGRQAVMTCEYRCKEGVEMRFESSLSDEAFTYSDPNRILQVLINYLGNASKNTSKGSIILTCEQNKEDNTYVFAVTDTGCGIPVDEQKSIFDRYKKLSNTKEGSGIGLNICRNVAKKLNGRVALDETYHDGARFLLILPIITNKPETNQENNNS